MLETLGQALAHAAAEGPTLGLRFVDSAERETFLTWPEVQRRARVAAGALRARGVQSGDRVVLIFPTGPGFFDAFFGCALLGAVPVPLYPPVRLGRMDAYVERTAAMITQVEAVAVITDARVGRALGQVALRCPVRAGWLRDEALTDGEPTEVEVDPDSLGLVQFSSGSTQDPKPVALTHRALLAQGRVLTEVVKAASAAPGSPAPAGVSWLPLYHDMGLIGCLLPALCVPGPLTLIPPEAFLAKPALWLRAISRHRGTVSPAPDFAYALCTERIRDADLVGVDLSSWRLALDGAEPIATRTLAAFAERFAPYGLDPHALTPVYGLSEMALAVTFTPTGRGPRPVIVEPQALAEGRVEHDPAGVARMSVGRALPGFDVQIGPPGSPAPAQTVGRVYVRGPSMMAGYLGREDAPVIDGWLDTGDLGFLDEGELVIAGRAKDVIVHRGRNHAPQDLERAADAVEGVRTGCVVAVGDLTEEGERVLVFAEVRAPRAGLAEEVATAVRSAAGIDPHLVVLLTPGTLPRTSSGKLQRAATLAQWRAHTLLPPAALTPLHLAGLLAKSWVGHVAARLRA